MFATFAATLSCCRDFFAIALRRFRLMPIAVLIFATGHTLDTPLLRLRLLLPIIRAI